jgi:hypothetical protein
LVGGKVDNFPLSKDLHEASWHLLFRIRTQQKQTEKVFPVELFFGKSILFIFFPPHSTHVISWFIYL